MEYADFYALMPPNNAADVAPGDDLDFPQDGPSNGTAISRTGPDSFNLVGTGVYQILFCVEVNQSGQLVLTLNGTELPYTVTGRYTGSSMIVGMSIIQTSAANSVLTVRNPSGNFTTLGITPLAGGTWPVSAHLIILKIA